MEGAKDLEGVKDLEDMKDSEGNLEKKVEMVVKMWEEKHFY